MNRKTLALALGCALISSTVGCRQDMYDQPKTKDLSSSDFFKDGQSARPIPEGTVPRGFLREDQALYRGLTPEGTFVSTLPLPLTKALLLRGRERFDIFCSPCHGRQGNGRGMIVQRGFKQPTSFHDERLRNQPIGYFFDVMTNGFGQMSSYASQVPPEDRWAIASYVRVLQLSQHARISDLSKEDRAKLEQESPGKEMKTKPAPEKPGGHEGNG